MEKKPNWFVRNRSELLLFAFLLVITISTIVDWNEAAERIDTRIDDLIETEMIEKRRADSLQAELDSLHVMSWETIEYWVDTLGIEHKDVVMQQISLETGQLSSTICHENNNLFGMKEPRVRPTTALGTNRNHAYYSNFIDSIKDYKLWQDNMYDGGNYYTFLADVGYAEAKHYITALKSI